MSTDAKRKANSKYRDKVIIKQQLDLNKNTDKDIIRYLNSSGNKMSTIKKAIRNQMGGSKQSNKSSKKNSNKSTTKKSTSKSSKKKTKK